VDRGTGPTFQPRAVARALAAIIALLVAGLVGFVAAHGVAEINPASIAPDRPPAASAPTPLPPILTDLGRNDLASVVTVEAELQNGSEESLGTGWIFDSKGDVVTNAHVINGAGTLRVTDRANHTHVARLVQSSASIDLAVIRVTGTLVGTPLPIDPNLLTIVPVAVITLASSRATGHADMTEERLIGLDASVPLAAGSIQAGQSSPQEYNDMLHLTGAQIYEGNSGGPVIDTQGQVIGIVTLASPAPPANSNSAPDAYAIPISRVLTYLRTWVALG
jgi:S1-C subfamily serine protease